MLSICLMYHDVFVQSPEESGLASDMYKISVEEFEKQLISIKKITEEKHTAVVLTFDDGGSSFYTPISMILDKYQLKGFFFIATKYINTDGFLSSEQIRDIERRGHVIGSHSHSHPENLSALNQKEIEYEWDESIRILSSILNHPVVSASIPNGYSSNTVIKAAQRAGIEHLFTSKPSCKEQTHKDIILNGRYVILSGMTEDDVAQLIVSKGKRQMLWLKWAALSVPKFLLGNKYEVVKQKIFG